MDSCWNDGWGVVVPAGKGWIPAFAGMGRGRASLTMQTYRTYNSMAQSQPRTHDA